MYDSGLSVVHRKFLADANWCIDLGRRISIRKGQDKARYFKNPCVLWSEIFLCDRIFYKCGQMHSDTFTKNLWIKKRLKNSGENGSIKA